MGKFSKAFITFDNNLLNQLKDEEGSCVEVVNLNHHIALHPFQLNDYKNSIREILKAGITRYNKHLGGILLGFRNVKLLTDLGPISFDNEFIHIDLEADFFLFKPEVGKLLKATVVKTSADHVGCLLYNAFNISLPQPRNGKKWIGHTARAGQEVSIKITYIDFNFRFPYIRGELIEILSKPEKKVKIKNQINFEDLEYNEEEYIETKPAKKKSKKTKIKVEELEYDEESQNGGIKQEIEEDEDVKPKLKKSKRQKIKVEPVSDEEYQNGEVNGEEPAEEESDEAAQKKSKKKKRKLAEESLEIEETPKIKKRRLESFSEPNISSNENEESHISDLQSRKKKKKHSKHVDEVEVYIEAKSEKKSKKKKKDKIRIKQEEESLDDFNLTRLFDDPSLDFRNATTTEMADSQDRKSKKRRSSQCERVSLNEMEIRLPPDSDLDEILNGSELKEKKSKKRKISLTDYETSSKRIKVKKEKDLF